MVNRRTEKEVRKFSILMALNMLEASAKMEQREFRSV